MLTRLQILQNIGKFDAATSNVQLPRLLEIYAENRRGKTTLAAICHRLPPATPLRLPRGIASRRSTRRASSSK